MQNLLAFLRENKIARLLLAALIVFSFFAVFTHHHEAGEDAHDCAVCRLAQVIAFALFGWLIVWIASVRKARFAFVRETPAPACVRVSSHGNRAPPFSR